MIRVIFFHLFFFLFHDLRQPLLSKEPLIQGQVIVGTHELDFFLDNFRIRMSLID